MGIIFEIKPTDGPHEEIFEASLNLTVESIASLILFLKRLLPIFWTHNETS